MHLRIPLLLSLLLVAAPSFGKPPSREIVERYNQTIKELKEAIAGETSEAAKIALIKDSLAGEQDVNMRRLLIQLVEMAKGPALEELLTEIVTKEEDAVLRSHAATLLGRNGSEKSLAVLAKVASSDRTTRASIGDIGIATSARGPAMFALAELVERYPKLAKQAAAELRKLPEKVDPPDSESLADARRQALFQVTRDEALLKPFFERLKSKNTAERENGIIAFQYLKLKTAPPEVVAALADDETGVRSWAALVLGAIGDKGTVDKLMAVAADAKQDRSVRTNVIFSLGQMKAMPAAELMEKLLADPDFAASAAICLYRITGRKVKEFPEGYNAD